MSATVIPTCPHPAATLKGGLDFSGGYERKRTGELIPVPRIDPRPRALSVATVADTIKQDLLPYATKGAKSHADARARLDVLLGKVFGAGRLSHRDVATALRSVGAGHLVRPSRQRRRKR